ncbi:hypothetical protein LTR10_011654 [Elasticomyces elasticus]|uniref:Uncharacterized protein n=1 Tax=Exophiala sideris TaxID=1016849 RepID=A0ABR0JDP4_9EURO|nr:hypothetical protein LTR10_011654 [Elasticomyces elasticus]KAK5031887.1 hypothetical protein LTS07_004508 [Exophiala sideris]KAK5040816.1 hypothetical protein LTR13_003117 [Exophiala sideris]KAK5061848.1 hypothetical protein LTR69_005032 [Exophiala sideris]KAK5184548.1 hypothetical protein LTR44_003223 [Eurotiomycetes sp. CCFEE 6388]
MADAIITKECLRILGTISLRPHSNIIDLPDTIWRTLCADRDEKGDPAPRFYRVAMLHLLQISTVPLGPEDAGLDLLDSMSSIDTEELLGNETPNHVKTFLTVIRDITWKRRTFRSKVNDHAERFLVGLAPPDAKVGDQVCVLYGCSVPVILRRLAVSEGKLCWKLVGDAYVHGVMDGEAIRDASSEELGTREQDFEIR